MRSYFWGVLYLGLLTGCAEELGPFSPPRSQFRIRAGASCVGT